VSTGKATVVKDTAASFVSTLIAQVFAFALGIYIRRVLGPESMGVWALLQVVVAYVAYTNLGIVNAVARQIPMMRGKGAPEETLQKTRNAGYTYLTFATIVTSAAVLGYAFWKRAELSAPLFFGLVTVAGVTFLERGNNYWVQLLYAEKKFIFASRYKIYSTLVNAALVLSLTGLYHLYGFYGATLLSFLFNRVYLRWKSRIGFCIEWRLGEIKKLLSFGVPLWGLGFVTALFNSLDKLCIGKLLGMKSLGVYSLATLAGGYLFMFPNMFQAVLVPRTFERFGDDKDKGGREKYSLVPGRLMVVYFSLGIGAIAILSGPFCRALLPAYTDGLPALKALLYAYCFMALTQQMGHILLGCNRHLWMIPVFAGVGGLVVTAASRATADAHGLFYIAIVMAAGQLACYVFSAFFALSKVYNAHEAALQLFMNILPLAVSALVLFFLSRWGLDDGSPARTLLASALYLGLLAAFLLTVEKSWGILRMTREAFSSLRPAPAVAEAGEL
jgi:O-antigen/teichoic acid export membrane protein